MAESLRTFLTNKGFHEVKTVFEGKEGTDIESAAQGRQGQYWQPFILSLGPELNPKQFFIVADKLAIPTGTEA